MSYTRLVRLPEGSALALMLVRADNRRRKGIPMQGDGHVRDRLTLPFALTGAQQRSIREIEGDMAQPHPMLRLLQAPRPALSRARLTRCPAAPADSRCPTPAAG